MKKLVRLQDFEDHALKTIPTNIGNFYNYGAGSAYSMKLNNEAYKRIRIFPRVLRDVSKRDISTTVLGQKVSMPVGVAPTGIQKGAHEDGECANAKAAEAAGTIFILSTFSNYTMREVADAAPKAIKWFQMSILKDRNCATHFVRRAEEADFKAIVLTVDNPVTPKSKSANVLERPGVSFAILEDFFNFTYPDKNTPSDASYVASIVEDSLTWEDVAWLNQQTKLPIVLKGILTKEDAILGVKYGASAILVSNHGGRQFDGTPATIEALPEIVKAVGDKVEVYVDGGIRQGSDVFKALALGAKMVFIGRPMLWGLACGGKKGAQAVLEILKQEINEVFAFTGCSKIQDITKEMVMHEYNLRHY